MCYEVRCSACGKTTWGGCGRHVQSVYQRIQEAQRCFCKEWPGINTTAAASGGSKAKPAANSTGHGPLTSSTCTLL